MSRDYELIKRLADYIEAHPEEHDQSVWGYRNACGTTACAAGHTVILAGHTPKWDDDLDGREGFWMMGVEGFGCSDVGDVAQDLLGLSGHEATRLFYSSPNEDVVPFLRTILEEDR